jgi:hypothetical protein
VEDLEVGAVYTHERTGNDYIITRYDPGKYQTKDPDSGRWHDAVEYSPTENPETRSFVRQADDFNAKFKRV